MLKRKANEGVEENHNTIKLIKDRKKPHGNPNNHRSKAATLKYKMKTQSKD